MTLYVCYYKNDYWCCYLHVEEQSIFLPNGTDTVGIPTFGRRRLKTAPIRRKVYMTMTATNWKSWALGI